MRLAADKKKAASRLRLLPPLQRGALGPGGSCPHPADAHGNVYFTRRRVNEAFLEALLEEFHKNGAQIIHRAGQESPATFLKVLAQLVPRELSVEHSGSIIGKLSDEQLAAMVRELERQIAALNGETAKVIDAEAEPKPERGIGTLGWRKRNPKTPPHLLAKARERARRLAEARKAARAAKQEQGTDCTGNERSLPSPGEEPLK